MLIGKVRATPTMIVDNLEQARAYVAALFTPASRRARTSSPRTRQRKPHP
jgi:hypothetical protein